MILIWLVHFLVHPRNSTWNLEMMVSNRNQFFQGSIFRFHVCFGGCNGWYIWLVTGWFNHLLVYSSSTFHALAARGWHVSLRPLYLPNAGPAWVTVVSGRAMAMFPGMYPRLACCTWKFHEGSVLNILWKPCRMCSIGVFWGSDCFRVIEGIGFQNSIDTELIVPLMEKLPQYCLLL